MYWIPITSTLPREVALRVRRPHHDLLCSGHANDVRRALCDEEGKKPMKRGPKEEVLRVAEDSRPQLIALLRRDPPDRRHT